MISVVRNKVGTALQATAFAIAVGPGKLIASIYPDTTISDTVLACGISAALSSPITLPLFILGSLIAGKNNQ